MVHGVWFDSMARLRYGIIECRARPPRGTEVGLYSARYRLSLLFRRVITQGRLFALQMFADYNMSLYHDSFTNHGRGATVINAQCYSYAHFLHVC